MNEIKILYHNLVVGEPLPWPIYQSNGQLILDKGYILKTEDQKAFLLSVDLYRIATKQEIDSKKAKPDAICPSEVSPFDTLNSIISLLRETIENIHENVKADYNQIFMDLAGAVQNLCSEHVDHALGALMLDQDAPYTNLHPVLCAILTEILTKRRKIPEQDRKAFIAAALTQNVGMWHEQDILSAQTSPLTDQQRKVINEHPHKSREIIKGLGIDNKAWLDTILFHHERFDGKGYPKGLSGNAISESARILAIADIYSAMILPRQYRDGIFVKKALSDIFMQRGSTVDENHAHMLIREIGIYPPGAFVMLNNGEIAIVLKRNFKRADCPFVLSIMNPQGFSYDLPRKRDTGEQQIFTIKKMVSRPKNMKINPDRIWGINNRT